MYFPSPTDLMFGVKLDSDAPRLLSISSDRTIVSLSIKQLSSLDVNFVVGFSRLNMIYRTAV